MMNIDLAECGCRGAIGAVGAIPGTLAAHPFDVVKMRQQVSGMPALGMLKRGNIYGGVGSGIALCMSTRQQDRVSASIWSTFTVAPGRPCHKFSPFAAMRPPTILPRLALGLLS